MPRSKAAVVAVNPETIEKALVPYTEETLPEVVVIDDNETYEQVGEYLKHLKSRQKDIQELRKSVLKPLDDAKSAMSGMFDPVLRRYSQRELALKQALAEYTRRLERNRRELEAKLRDEQRREQEAAEAKAAKLRSQGKTEQAAAVVETVRPIPIIVADQPKVSGISTRKTWKAELVDLQSLIEYAAQFHQEELLLPNMTELHARARATDGSANIPGVRFYEEETIAVRAS